MDKIYQIADNPSIAPQAASKKSTPGEFQNALSSVLASKKPETGVTGKNMPLNEINPVYVQTVEPGETDLLSNTEQLLGMLDDYASDLFNQTKSLKELAPLMNEIGEKAENLLGNSEDQPVTHEGLKEIANQVALKAKIEYIKFYRGDLL